MSQDTLDQCPYCKIRFTENPWAIGGCRKVVCANCRNYYEAKKRQDADDN